MLLNKENCISVQCVDIKTVKRLSRFSDIPVRSRKLPLLKLIRDGHQHYLCCCNMPSKRFVTGDILFDGGGVESLPAIINLFKRTNSNNSNHRAIEVINLNINNNIQRGTAEPD